MNSNKKKNNENKNQQQTSHNNKSWEVGERIGHQNCYHILSKMTSFNNNNNKNKNKITRHAKKQLTMSHI